MGQEISAVQDIPLGELGAGHDDALGVSPYAGALVKFIESCGTPMTIAIQGDWGTGKTSLMRIVESKLSDKVHKVWFNTWQYAQFSLADALPISFLTAIAQTIAVEDDKSALMSQVSSIARSVAPQLLRIAAGAVGGSAGREVMDSAIDSVGGKEAFPTDLAGAISSLKNSFSDAVDSRCNALSVDRLVIFIDDLDRVPPARAIELLECLKMFLDVPRCVFVLALDYQVVQRGLKEKMGLSEADIGGRSFFDKIIQMPFSMPTASYRIDTYLNQLLNQIGSNPREEDLNTYQDLLKFSIGMNPRSTKRLINVMLLMNIVDVERASVGESTDVEAIESSDESDREAKAHRDLVMFGLACMQQAYEGIYSYLNRLPTHSEALEALKKRETYGGPDDEVYKTPDGSVVKVRDIEYLTRFMDAFYTALDRDGNGEITDDELTVLRLLLGTMSLTAVESGQHLTDVGDTVYNDIVTSFSRSVLEDIKLQLGQDGKNLGDDGHAKQHRGIDKPKSRVYWFRSTENLCWNTLVLSPHSPWTDSYREGPYDLTLLWGYTDYQLDFSLPAAPDIAEPLKAELREHEEKVKSDGWELVENPDEITGNPGIYFRKTLGEARKLRDKSLRADVVAAFTSVSQFQTEIWDSANKA